MKRVALVAIAGAVVVIAAILLNPRDSSREIHLRPQGKDSGSTFTDSVIPPQVRESATPTNELARAASEMLPLAEAFLRRVEPLAREGVILPFGLPLASHEIRNARFAGGPSNLVCTFDLGGHSVFGCHAVNHNGKEAQGVNLFRRKGRDESGIQRNIIQLTDDPTANESQLRMLTDTNLYPACDLQAVGTLAQRVLTALRPDVAVEYRLAQAWQEHVGANALPFYTFAFVKRGPLGSDPGNLMRDEIMIGFKSTAKGLVLDSFEDNSIAFLGSEPVPRSPGGKP